MVKREQLTGRRLEPSDVSDEPEWSFFDVEEEPPAPFGLCWQRADAGTCARIVLICFYLTLGFLLAAALWR